MDDAEYDEEQQRQDREWYGLDEGQDEYHNAFSNVSNEYTKMKEQQNQERVQRVKHLTAKQAAKKKDNELWEKNLMIRSGAVYNTSYDDDFDEEGEAKVHLLVTNIIPPFLDGRIVFTKPGKPGNSFQTFKYFKKYTLEYLEVTCNGENLPNCKV